MELKVIDIETAKLAKEVGFAEETDHYWANYYTGEPMQKWKFIKVEDSKMPMLEYPAPTQELLRQYLRTEHNIHIQMGLQDRMNPQMNSGFEFQGYCPILIIFYESVSLQQYSELPIKPNSSYEKALEAGLKEALKYLLNKKE